MRKVAVILLLGALAAGCRTTRAAAPIQPTPLDVPPAPPRVVVATPAPELNMPEPVPDLPPPPAPAPAKPRPAANSAPRETQKPEVKPDDTVATATPAPPQGTPAPLLRTPATADTAAADRAIRETMKRAEGGLRAVVYDRLSPERKKAYDQATDFLSTAEAQLKTQNFEMAKELADKADKLARELQSR